ncbi:AAA domain-containing protein [Actinoplanes sp. NPDC089786]|uniref:DEAD/DEAH box helicase n=1 Tax=Actinoplanes sp. NPDC089786 TaxID=3155185 RepID=UPI0034213127
MLATAERRRSAAGVYVFRLSRPSSTPRGTLVHLRRDEALRGRVLGTDGDRLTVAFDDAVDRARIPDEGELVAGTSDLVQRIQKNAVARVRAGTTLHPRMVALLVDGQFGDYRPSAESPRDRLDEFQTAAFQHALEVPDLLCVVGPPGTGKTRTIVQIATAAAARGERVLIASQTNTAVDNVIEKMPSEVISVRVGNAERFTESVRHKTIASTAAELQRQTLERTDVSRRRLAPWHADPSPVTGWLRRLDGALADADQAETGRRAAESARDAAAAAIDARVGGLARSAEGTARRLTAEAEKASSRVKRIASKLADAETRSAGPFGVIHRWRAGRLRARLATEEPRRIRADVAAEEARSAHGRLRDELRRQIDDHPSVREAAGLAAGASSAIEQALHVAGQAGRELVRLHAVVLGAPGSPPTDRAALGDLAGWCRAWEPFLRERAALLDEWRVVLAQPTERLHAELIRYSSVIGATCIGVGVQANLLSDLDFDLAVIDEAGQIPAASALVPMTRARRVVLVGDHHQLPPFVDDDVRHWLTRKDLSGTGVDPRQLSDLLTRSAFERLFQRAPAGNQLLLSRQRRMPAVLADFVSAEFYGGRLISDTGPRPPAPIFRSPLAVVDTSGLPASERAENRRRQTETWQEAGCDNRAEGRIILTLIQQYASLDWVVIAPYRAQVQLINLWATELLGAEAVRDRIGTVDSFQGRERDIVLFSFTRSNQSGNVGFLSELRRLNVAITRARQQVVLVGDRDTLTAARDPAFRGLAQRMFRYADEHGDVVPAQRLRERLP